MQYKGEVSKSLHDAEGMAAGAPNLLQTAAMPVMASSCSCCGPGKVQVPRLDLLAVHAKLHPFYGDASIRIDAKTQPREQEQTSRSSTDSGSGASSSRSFVSTGREETPRTQTQIPPRSFPGDPCQGCEGNIKENLRSCSFLGGKSHVESPASDSQTLMITFEEIWFSLFNRR